MRRIVLVVVITLALGPPLFAQRTTGGISGTIKDASGAVLPGVTVAVSGPNIVGSQTAASNELGFYRIIGLPPGEYQVSFTMAGFKSVTHRGLRVGLGSTVEQNANLEVSQLQEALDVVAEAPVVDTTSNEVGSNYDRSWVENAPLRRFSFFDLVKSSPGTLDGGDGSRRSMVYGSGYDENSFQLDGVDITENFFNESSAEPNVDAIDEVEVLSLGAPAEYGNLTGAVFNIVTRQGTNAFHGDANFFLQTDGLTSNNTENLKNPDGSFVDACGDSRCPFFRDKFQDFTAQLGGPIVKDKLWFFASFQAQRDYFANVAVDHSDPLSIIRDRADRYLGKINWQVTPKHKIIANFHLDKKDTDNGLSANSAPSTAWTRHSKTPTPGVYYTGVLSAKTVVDVRFSGFYGDVSGGPTDPNQPRDLPRFYNLDTGFVSGGHYYWYEVKPRRTTATAKISHLADNFLGASHDFKFGVQYSDAVAKGLYGYNDFVYTYTSNGVQYGYGYERQPFSYSGNSRNLGFFFDDSIRVNDRVSFNLGLRYDYDKAYSAAQDEIDEFGSPTGVHYPKTELYTWNNFSPRVGFNLKLTKDGKTVLKGHWGRYYRAIATGEFANVIGPSIKPTFSGTYDFATGTFPDATFFEGNSNLGVDANYKSPHTDQYIASLERELVKGLGAQVNYVYKRGRDYAAWREIAGQYVPVPFTDNLGDNPTGRTFDIYQLVSDPAERQFRITNPDGVKSDVHAVTFELLKRMTGKWQLNASANWLKATGRVQESKGSVGIQQRSGLQFRDFGKNINDFVNTDGRLRLDVTWNFKLQAVYQLPAGFLISANITNRDNAWIVRRANVSSSITNIPEGTLIMLQPRGENGRLPRVTFVDMRLQKDFKFGKYARLSVFADALNLTNNDAYENVLSSTVTSSVYLWPDSVIDPRRIMLGAKFRF
jgi:outer membrane receptor protein involved in Fe transport